MELNTDLTAALNDAAAASLPPIEAEETTPEVVEEEVVEQPDEAAEPEEGAVEEPSTPEGVVIPPTITEGLATEFTVMDAEGPVEVPDIVIEYKANGKVRRDRLDQVVKMAQWAAPAVEKAAKADEAMRQAEEAYAVLAEREAALERLLTDDDYYDAVREAYTAETSPERRAERAEREAQELRMQAQLAPIAEKGKQFFERELEPALDMIVQALPAVTREELDQRVEVLLRMHAVEGPNGAPIVPPEKYDVIRRAMVDDIAVWAQVLNARRQPPAAKPSPEAQKAKAELERARIDAQKAKRAVGRAVRPVATGVSKPSKPKSAAPATVDEAVESALSDILSGIS